MYTLVIAGLLNAQYESDIDLFSPPCVEFPQFILNEVDQLVNEEDIATCNDENDFVVLTLMETDTNTKPKKQSKISDFFTEKSVSKGVKPKLDFMPIDDGPLLLPGQGVYPVENAVSQYMDAYIQIRVTNVT